jgi:hypothetical protein
MPEDRRMLAEPGELLVRSPAPSIDIGVDKVDLCGRCHRLPRVLKDDRHDDTASTGQNNPAEPADRAPAQVSEPAATASHAQITRSRAAHANRQGTRPATQNGGRRPFSLTRPSLSAMSASVVV